VNAISIDTLKLRIPPIEYLSPPVCEVTLSGSGFPSIFLDAFGGPGAPGPILPPDYPDNPFFRFPPTTPVPICVTIARDDGTGHFVVVDICVEIFNCGNGLICIPPPPIEGCFIFSVITDQGSSPFSSPPVCIVGPTVETLPATDVT
jgi:hypothetical protein